MTLTNFCAQSHLPSSLIRAVVRQMGGWESFKESAHDIANHGIDGGFNGFIYYTDTVKFTTRNRSVILEALRNLADDLGETTIQCLAGFNCLEGYDQEEIAEGLYNSRSDNRTQVYNALAWFAGEEVARSYADNC